MNKRQRHTDQPLATLAHRLGASPVHGQDLWRHRAQVVRRLPQGGMEACQGRVGRAGPSCRRLRSYRRDGRAAAYYAGRVAFRQFPPVGARRWLKSRDSSSRIGPADRGGNTRCSRSCSSASALLLARPSRGFRRWLQQIRNAGVATLRSQAIRHVSREEEPSARNERPEARDSRRLRPHLHQSMRPGGFTQ
jgi:hypothetical protein